MTPDQQRVYEVIWFAAFGHLEQAQAGVRASDLRATVLGIIAAIGSSGLVVVSAQDVKFAADALAKASHHWPGYGFDEADLVARLRAALPEETTTDGR